jgi:hypothetical protein
MTQNRKVDDSFD